MMNHTDPTPSPHEPAPAPAARRGTGRASGRWVVAGILSLALIVAVVELKFRRPAPRRVTPPATLPAGEPAMSAGGVALPPPGTAPPVSSR